MTSLVLAMTMKHQKSDYYRFLLCLPLGGVLVSMGLGSNHLWPFDMCRN
jgi:hypothetical protein